MVKRAANFTRSGVTDWLLQRITAVIIGLYTLVVLYYFMTAASITFQSWQLFILSGWMKIFTLIAVASFVAHGWIGLWTVVTDYIKAGRIRFVCHVIYGLVLLCMLLWTVQILWG